MIDLHMHSIFSDGTDSLDELLEKIVASGIKYFSITDHDNVASFYEMRTKQDFVKNNKLVYMSGLEISSDFNGNSMHLLVYGYEDHLDVIESIMDKIRELRLNRVRLHIANLETEFGITFSKEEIDWLFSQQNPSKPHIANLLINNGYGESVSEVIKKYLYHKYTDFKVDAIEIVKNLSSQGLMIGIAHPLGGVDEKRVDRESFEYNVKTLKNCGLAFLECYYSLYSKEEREMIRQVADKYNLKLSGGSDYHGKNKSVKLGDLGEGYQPQVQDFTILNN